MPELDTDPLHGYLLYGVDTELTAGQIEFVGSTLAIVPEPSTLIIIAIGLMGLIAVGWRRTKSRSVAL